MKLIIPASGPEALALLFALPGSSYSDPEFSRFYGIAPSAIGFVDGVGLGAEIVAVAAADAGHEQAHGVLLRLNGRAQGECQGL